MQVVVVFESMYGNTHEVAKEIAAGMDPVADVVVSSVDAFTLPPTGVDLLVIGAPTHLHGLSTARTRGFAVDAADADDTRHVDEHALGEGVREWLEHLPDGLTGRTAAFDTRQEGSTLKTGRASRGIAKRLRHHGFELIVEPESFLVDKHDQLVEGETARARQWGVRLADVLTASVAN